MATETISQLNAKTFTPEDIVNEVVGGRVRVPSFQRGFRWRWEDVRRLFDSIVKGYPIGSLLLWERPAGKERIRLGALDIDAPGGTSLFVVDGQQRVTSLANALTEEGAQDPRFALAFDLRDNSFERPDSDPHLVPLHIIFDLEKLLLWFAEHPEIKSLLNAASRVTKTIRQYAIPAYVVKQQDEAVLRDIFDRMNNYGRRLSRAEIFSALHGGQSTDGASVKISDIAEAVDTNTGFGPVDDDTVLRAVLARRGGNVSRDIRSEFNKDGGVTRDFAGESPEAAYREGQRALEAAIRFLQQHAEVPHFSFLPYRYLLVALTRFFAHFPTPSPRNRTLLRRFFWRAALAGPTVFRAWTEAMRALATRIEAGDESGSVQRLLEPFHDRRFTLPRLDHFRTSTAGTRLILCALWSLGPRSPATGGKYDLDDLASALHSEDTPKAALQVFFPRVPDKLRAWTANRAILLDDGSDDASAAILGVSDGAAQFSASTRASILRSHALDKSMLKSLQEGDLEAFLRARQERLAEVVMEFVASMAETRFEDTPPLDELNLDDDDERRDDALA